MLCRLVEQHDKPITQVVVENATVRGAIIEDGAYFVDRPRDFDGIHAVADYYLEKDFEEIKAGERVNRIPTRTGERYATTEVTTTGLAVGDKLGVSGGKFVKNTNGRWIYGGEYQNPYGLAMYIVEKGPKASA